jgi:S-adenosylmethionine synthetase
MLIEAALQPGAASLLSGAPVNRSSYVFTSESVSEGHPDKVADRISDTVVDAFIGADPEARVACETMVTTNRIIIGGEVRAGKPGNDKAANKAFTKEIIASLQPKIRAAVKDIGYEQKGFHWEKAKFHNCLHGQSAAHRQGVDAGANKDEGAGDQGIMFGYACDRDARANAGDPAVLAQHPEAPRRVRHSGERPEAGAGRKEPGHAALRKRQAG